VQQENMRWPQGGCREGQRGPGNKGQERAGGVQQENVGNKGRGVA
jgi:hypothetical protein